jgi:hypothetical protein
MKKFAFVAFAFGLLGVAGIAYAADKNDPTGTWKYKVKFGKNEVEQTLKLELKDGKLTGTVSGGKNDNKIEEGTFKDGEINFNVVRERKGEKFTTKYSGKVTEDTIKGTITSEFNGKENKMDWEAKRAKDEEKKKD